MNHGGVNDPLQRSRLKMQFAFGLGIRYPAQLSPVVNRIRTTRFQRILNRYLRRWWSMQPVSKRREPFAHRYRVIIGNQIHPRIALLYCCNGGNRRVLNRLYPK